MKRLFIIFTIATLGFIISQSCTDIEPQVNFIELEIEQVSRSGIDTSIVNTDTILTEVKNKE
tara:strand:+ start:5786 stop:5971 length:186 start_codon:yes stop_codon:yes gene_type:complete